MSITVQVFVFLATPREAIGRRRRPWEPYLFIWMIAMEA
jgi:hypothetical protein